MFNYLRDTNTLPKPTKERVVWGTGGVWRGRGRKKINKFSRIRTLSMIERSGAYERESLVMPAGKCENIF